jgi:agmatinase
MATNDSKEAIIARFDPNGPGISGNLFGLPFSPENCELIVVPAPWEVTVSYHGGAAMGPKAILDASSQIDLYIKDIPDAWKYGVSMLPVPADILEEGQNLRMLSARHIRRIEQGESVDAEDPVLKQINDGCEKFNQYIKSTTKQLLKDGKAVAVLGGDHSTPLGFIQALCEQVDRFGILQIDAHADLRRAYEGFTYSHASIMYNVLKMPGVSRLVQLGVRDFCEEEKDNVRRGAGRIVPFYDEDLKAALFDGKSWDNLCVEIIKQLPANVYISFDIDGLDPKLCPNTGTPVAGGFEYQQMVYLLKKIVLSGKRIIGFDLCEVAPGKDDWDANVGARILFQLCHWTAVSQGKLKAI